MGPNRHLFRLAPRTNRQDVPSRRCCGEHRRSSRVITAGSRWRRQCSALRCGRSSDSIPVAEETDSSPDPEEERQQHSCSSLLSISLISEFAHATLTVSVKLSFFFLAPKVTKRMGISRGLIDRSTHAWGLDASNSSWVKHRRMHRCVVATPLFFFIPLPPRPTYREKCEEKSLTFLGKSLSSYYLRQGKGPSPLQFLLATKGKGKRKPRSAWRTAPYTCSANARLCRTLHFVFFFSCVFFFLLELGKMNERVQRETKKTHAVA